MFLVGTGQHDGSALLTKDSSGPPGGQRVRDKGQRDPKAVHCLGKRVLHSEEWKEKYPLNLVTAPLPAPPPPPPYSSPLLPALVDRVMACSSLFLRFIHDS